VTLLLAGLTGLAGLAVLIAAVNGYSKAYSPWGVNSAVSLAAGLPVGRPSARCLVIAAYVIPAVSVWVLLGVCLAALPMAGVALVAAVAYGGCYGLAELTGRTRLSAPGRRWQVPQSMMIGASPRRRVLVWGAVLGPGFATRNPYAGFGLLPLAVAAMRPAGTWAVLALAAGIGLTHGGARALALLRDVRDAQQEPESLSVSAAGQLDLLLKVIYWRRLDGGVLLALAAVSGLASVLYFQLKL
jgi:hypothetical protein